MVRENVIFEITKEHLHTGLRGFPVGFCSTSYVDKQKGLFYAGRPIFEVVTWKLIEVVYLLLHGQCHDADAILAFEKDLLQRSCITDFVKTKIQNSSKDIDPVLLLSQILLEMADKENVDDDLENCLCFLAKIPVITAMIIKHLQDEDISVDLPLQQDYFSSFYQMLSMHAENMQDALQKILILHMDHGGGVADAFVAKIAASCHCSLYSSIAAGMIAFAGDINGNAHSKSLAFVQSLQGKTSEEIADVIREKLEKKETIYGFGYPDMIAEDARASYLYNYARKHFPHHLLIKTALVLRYEARKIFVENNKKNLFANVDAITGSVMVAAGFTQEKIFPLFLAMARSMGIAIQIYHEKISSFTSKKAPLVHPLYFYRAKS